MGGGFAGTCTPVAADFMLAFLGKAAAGGIKVRGSTQASEQGPLTEKKGRVMFIFDSLIFFFVHYKLHFKVLYANFVIMSYDGRSTNKHS